MALISLRQLLDHAAENDYGVPAFNVNNLEQVRAIMEAADESDSPVILQASAGARKYAGSNFLKHLYRVPSKSSRISRLLCIRTTGYRQRSASDPFSLVSLR